MGAKWQSVIILKAFNKSQQLFPSYRGKAFKKIVDRFTRLEIFKKCLNWNTSARENKSAAENLR